MWTRATRWGIAALIGSAMPTVGCMGPPTDARFGEPEHKPIVAEESLTHALETGVALRVIDRLELDHSLRYRDIQIELIDGVIRLTGEVWSVSEKQRATDLVRSVAGITDVLNGLAIRPPL